ncbi:MAG: hypothetical protein ACOWYE_15105 [Desulfatiglandales bacterium]
MKCAICGIEVETIDEAIEQNWIHTFYEGEVEHGPLCSSCAETMICIGEDAVMLLKAKYHDKLRYFPEKTLNAHRNTCLLALPSYKTNPVNSTEVPISNCNHYKNADLKLT